MEESHPDSGRIATNLRACLILEVVANADAPLNPTDIANHIGLPKQTVHRVCHTLVREGFLLREPSSRTLRPGLRLRKFASATLQQSHFHVIRHKVLERLAADIGETVNFVMPELDGMSYVDRVETEWPFRVQLPIGTHVPFHCTASGKTYLASLSERKRNHMIETLKLARHTEATITDRERLQAQLREIGEQGHATDNEEFMDGMVAVAVPVRDTAGRYAASLAFHGPTVRLDIQGALERKPLLERAAAELSSVLFDSQT